MDEEGFPLVSADRCVRGGEPRVFRCLESGEAAYYQIQVLRRPPEAYEESSSKSSPRRSFNSSGDGRLAMCDVPRISYAKERRFRIERALHQRYEELEAAISHRDLRVEMNLSPMYHHCEDVTRVLHIPANQGCLCNDPLCPTVVSPPSKEVSNVGGGSPDHFRIASTPSSEKPKGKKREVQVSIWKEFLHGERVFDRAELKWENRWMNYMSFPWPQYLPYCFRLLQLLFLILRLIIPAISITGFYYHRVYRHLQIHIVGAQRGVEPIFTGKVYHGPIIYGVRVLGCPFCREKNATKLGLKYFESMYRERRQAAMR